VWALEEVGADYELVTMSAEEARNAEHRARHPLGRVPVLEDEQSPLFESTALVFHVAELYPEAGGPLCEARKGLVSLSLALTERLLSVSQLREGRDPDRAALRLLPEF
jgi:glutathione S-transferase